MELTDWGIILIYKYKLNCIACRKWKSPTLSMTLQEVVKVMVAPEVVLKMAAWIVQQGQIKKLAFGEVRFSAAMGTLPQR
jgi:hypothetical protein